jgi:hypothetical protein
MGYTLFYFNRFNYFYISLYLLILSLSYCLVYYLLQKFYEENYLKVEETLIITDSEKDDLGVYKAFDFKDKTLHSQYDLHDYLMNV